MNENETFYPTTLKLEIDLFVLFVRVENSIMSKWVDKIRIEEEYSTVHIFTKIQIRKFISVKLLLFCHPSIKTYASNAKKSRLIDT